MNAVLSLIERRYPLFYDLGTRHLRLTLAAFAALYLGIAVSMWIDLIATSEDLFTRAGPIIGGDFIVFQHVAERASDSDLAALYEMKTLKAELMARYPGHGEMNFGWMYPPTMFLFVAPFGDASYLAAYSAWVAAFAAIFLIVAYRLWTNLWAMAFAVSAPPFFQAIITGQNGLLTAALLALAGGYAERRPVIAGIAAGILTVKPQLGILVPIAFAAAGCWRAFAAAAVTAVLFGAVSVGAYGVEAWTSFIDAMSTHSGRMAGDGFPFNKLVTPFGFATMLGAPAAVAGAIQLAASLALATYVVIIWRRVKEWDLRVAALSTATMLVTPYAFYYEIVIMAPAMLLVAKRAVETGWLKFERESLIAVWILPLMMPGESGAPGLPICSVGAILAFFIAARRAWPAARVRFASEASSVQAGA